jgi:hypothetical protein
VSHRIFERKWCSRAILRACLFECPHKILAPPSGAHLVCAWGEAAIGWFCPHGRMTRNAVLGGGGVRRRKGGEAKAEPFFLCPPLLPCASTCLRAWRAENQCLSAKGSGLRQPCQCVLAAPLNPPPPPCWEVTTFQWGCAGCGWGVATTRHGKEKARCASLATESKLDLKSGKTTR